MSKLTQLDVCAGIGSFSYAARAFGVETVAQVEIDANRRELLNKHYPETMQLEDIYDVTADDIPRRIDILAGGTPCQDLSIAGYRKGLDGKRSSLWYEYLRLAKELKPTWVVWENVPGALSSNNGQDFATILMGLDELGYHVAWRVLDAQYFGVPQRRRRIFLVGHLRDGRSAKVLFEQESVQGSSSTRPASWERNARVAATLSKSASRVNRPGGQGAELDFYVYRNRSFGDYISDTVGRSILKNDDITNSDLVVGLNPQASTTAHSIVRKDGIAGTLGTTRVEGVLQNKLVRRLTPIECERLQGFPDNYTAGYSDTIRYQMLGDSIAVPCSEWLMKRIVEASA